MAKELVELKTVSIAKSCEVVSISECCYRYESVNGTENEQLGDLLVNMINDPFKRRWGFGLCFDFIRNVLGYKWNHKRVINDKAFSQTVVLQCRSSNGCIESTANLN